MLQAQQCVSHVLRLHSGFLKDHDAAQHSEALAGQQLLTDKPVHLAVAGCMSAPMHVRGMQLTLIAVVVVPMVAMVGLHPMLVVYHVVYVALIVVLLLVLRPRLGFCRPLLIAGSRNFFIAG